MKKRKISVKIGDFLAGKGFYIVLLICVAVIGASAWALFLSDRPQEEAIVAVSENTPESDTWAVKPSPTPKIPKAITVPDDDVLINKPAITPTAPPIQTPEPTPTPKPAQTPAFAPSEHSDDTPVKTIADLTFVQPVIGDTLHYYSSTELQESKTMGDWRTHLGIDYIAPEGTVVQAAADGKIASIKNDDMLGTVITIDHGFGLTTVYANLDSEIQVSVGQSVPVGAVIGEVGTTALSESADPAHLHFAMFLNGESVDPGRYLPK